MTQKEGLEKMAKFCAYQERCQSEVKTKLYGTGLSSDEIDNIICELIEQDFLNEERFAQAYVRGKFRHKSWGKVKIKQHLVQKGISSYCIKKGFQEIATADYYNKLHTLIEKKSKTLTEENPFLRNQKLARYLIGKGFESEIVWEEINS